MSVNRKYKQTKPAVLILSLFLLIVVGVGGTLAYLIASTETLTNEFAPLSVSCDVTEKFDGEKKTAVNVINDGTANAYIRVKLVSYRVNDQGQQIGGTAYVPSFTLGTDWFQKDGFYYYKKPVAPNENPATDLIDEMTLQSYTDVDGGKQVVEVMAEAIQSDGVLTDASGTKIPAVTDAWGVTVDADGNLVASSTSGN